ncbi:MAG: ShlB/FhaC/HecB family hemolysin secretion/activation protein, partial [Microcystaceae cyanobacterium]
LLYRNLTGIGDSISASYRPRVETIDGTYRLEFNYQAPLNPMNGTLNLNALIERNEVIEGRFESLNIRGESERYQITYRQPLIRTPREELALSIGFDYYTGQTFTFAGPTPFGFGPDEDGISRTSVFTFGQDYTLRDVSGAWAFRSQFRFGTGLFDATENPPPIPDGHFFSWLGQVQRVQVFNENNFLIIQLDLQLTPDPLLPSEQFVIGGGQSVRGYRQNVLAGDNGFRFSIEDRIILVRNEAENPIFTLAPFFDMGAVWNANDNPNEIIVDPTFIAGLGLGLIVQPIKNLNLRLDYAPPLVDLNVSGNNIQDYGFYFSASYNF